MAEFSAQLLRDTLRRIKSTDRIVPTHLVVTEQGLDFQAERLVAGDVTLEKMQELGVPEDIIGETARRAAILLGLLPK